MAVSSLGQLFKATAPVKKEGDKTISYSQFSMWSMCPQKWKLTYIDKHRMGGPSIHTVFGTSFHETIQWYLYVMFNNTIPMLTIVSLAGLPRVELGTLFVETYLLLSGL